MKGENYNLHLKQLGQLQLRNGNEPDNCALENWKGWIRQYGRVESREYQAIALQCMCLPNLKIEIRMKFMIRLARKVLLTQA